MTCPTADHANPGLRAASLLVAAVAGLAAAAPLRPTDVAGAYHRRVTISLANDQELGAEDVLEVAPVSPTSAYVRTRINFSNGHVCALHGVFDAQGPELVYHDPERVEGEAPCVLRLGIKGRRLEFQDGDTCGGYCGARGSFGDEGFPLSARRPITYMPRLLASSEYREAVAAHAAAGR